MAISSTQDCYVALELSRSKWLIGALLPGRSRITTTLVPGGDTAALLDVLTRLAARAALHTGGPVAFRVCYEAGYDGFWLARFLIGHGIETHVLDSACFLVSRRGRRAKTDRIDVEAMVLTLKAFLMGGLAALPAGQPPDSLVPAELCGTRPPRAESWDRGSGSQAGNRFVALR